MSEIVDTIRAHHRRRRYAMKLQAKLDRALESFVRLNATEWQPDMNEADRKKQNAQVKKLIAAARKGDAGAAPILGEVMMTDRAREPADEMRKINEKNMERLAKDLPVYDWWADIRGAGALGLATIIAEAGDLSSYPTHDKLWKRLGFAPYDGLAGSTWKRQSWRPRALTKDEWVGNPFSGERYAMMHQIAVWLRNAQCESKAKSETEYGRPTGRYGEAYVYRREHTAATHPDWSAQHAHMDALRYMMKRLLRDLWRAWREARKVAPEKVIVPMPPAERSAA